MLRKVSSIFGYSSFWMSSQPWLILREFLFFVQPSLLVPFQCLVWLLPHGQSFWLQSFGVCYSLVVTNFLMVWLNGSCQLWLSQQWQQSLLQQSNTQSTVLTSLKKHHGSSQPFHLSFHFLDGCQHQLKFQPLTHFGQLRKRKLLISTLMMPSLTLTLVTSEQLFLRYSL